MAQLPLRRQRSLVVTAALALFSIACGGESTETLTPATVEAAVATAQTDTVGEAAAVTPAVVVKASNGKPVSGVAVTFTVTSGAGAAVASGSATTGSNGVATAGAWTLGPAVGSYQVTATVPVLAAPSNAVVFNATAVPDAPAKLAFKTPPGPGGAGAVLPTFEVQLQDQYGNNVTTSGVQVTLAFGANPGGATLGGTVTQPTANGVATFSNVTVSAVGAGYTLVATAPGLTAVTSAVFAITGGARISGHLTVTSDLVLASAQQSAGTARVARVGTSGSATFRARRTASGEVTNAAAAGARVPQAKRSGGLATLGRGTRRRFVSDELIVILKPGAAGTSASAASASGAATVARGLRQRLDAIGAQRGADFRTTSISPVLRAARIKVNPRQLEAVAERLRQDPAVESVDRNGLLWATAGEGDPRARGVPTNPPTGRLAPFQAWHYNMIDLPRAWSLTTGSLSVIVAVIDDGIRFDHPALRNASQNNLLDDGYDFVSNDKVAICGSTTDSVGVAGDGDGYDSDPTLPKLFNYDEDQECIRDSLVAYGGHGLHVAGTIGAQRSTNGSTGVSPIVKIRPIRALNPIGSGSNYDIAQAVLWAVCLPVFDRARDLTITPPSTCQPARIINMSLGGPEPSTVLRNAIIQATSRGALVIAASGNTGQSDLEYPAAFPEVLSVAAVGPLGTRAAYSTANSGVDIAAPGGDFATEPKFSDGSINGDFGIWSLTYAFQQIQSGQTTIPAGSALYNLASNGTSMAAPHVSGVAALILAREPGLTAQQLRERLINFAVDIGPPGRDDTFGAGLVNAYNSLTQTLGPTKALFARLYNANTGAVVATAPVATDNTYAFNDVPAGAYRVYAGQDESADAAVGEPGRRWSAFGSTGKPTVLNVAGGEQSASFPVGFPSEQESNNSVAEADELVVGGYIQGNHAAGETDMLRVRIPAAGTYTFTTFATLGACGYALDEDTTLTLYDTNGTTILATNDDIDAANNNYCSRVTRTLTAGTYYVAIRGKADVLPAGGRYRVQVR